MQKPTEKPTEKPLKVHDTSVFECVGAYSGM